VPGAERRGVFLSYRRDDAGPYARSLQLQLSQRIPDARIFMDLDSIEPGLDFAEVIEAAVNSSAVLVALIGRQWLTLTGEDGARRLDNPDDYVRFEVTTALEHGVRVIPVLIDGASALRRQDLPEELHKLARLNAAKLSWDRYQDDADRLLDLIQRVLSTVGEQPLAEQDREHLDRKGGEEADADDPEELARQYQEAQEAAAPGETAASIPWVHVPSSGANCHTRRRHRRYRRHRSTDPKADSSIVQPAAPRSHRVNGCPSSPHTRATCGSTGEGCPGTQRARRSEEAPQARGHDLG
jgi:hypothetical protein